MIPGPGLERTRGAVAVVFALSGFAFASWISRIPAVRDALGLSPSELGLLLLCLSAGSVGGLPLSGPIVHRLGPAPAVLGGAVCASTGLVALAIGVASAPSRLQAAGCCWPGTGSPPGTSP
jgi:MFS family permease